MLDLEAINGTKQSRMDQVKFIKRFLPQILLGPFLNTQICWLILFQPKFFNKQEKISKTHQNYFAVAMQRDLTTNEIKLVNSRIKLTVYTKSAYKAKYKNCADQCCGKKFCTLRQKIETKNQFLKLYGGDCLIRRIF